MKSTKLKARARRADEPRFKRSGGAEPRVSIVMGSSSDYEVMKEAGAALEHLGVPFEIGVVSAHRTPHEMFKFAEQADHRGIAVVIAGAGGAAHLPGMIAAITELPVIGVPVANGQLNGEDALLSIVQMPRGVPVATVAINNAWNGGVLAAQILAAGGEKDPALLDKIRNYKRSLADKVIKMRMPKD